MLDNSNILKRSPSIRCHITDLINSEYSEEEKAIYTIFGKIRRVRIVGNLIIKKISQTEDPNPEDSMIKTQDDKNMRINFLINDGTGNLWFTVWDSNADNYQDYKPGDLVQIVGTVRYYNGKTSINVEFINKYDNPNYEVLHELEMIKYIKISGKKSQIESSNIDNDLKMEEEDIDNFISSEQTSENFEFEDFDELDEFSSDSLSFNEIELEEMVIDFIKKNDHGDGVSVDKIRSGLNKSKDVIEEILKRLTMNTKIYSLSTGIYKLYID